MVARSEAGGPVDVQTRFFNYKVNEGKCVAHSLQVAAHPPLRGNRPVPQRGVIRASYQEVVHAAALITPLPESLVCEYILENEELTPGKGFPILSALTSLIWLTRPGFPVLLV